MSIFETISRPLFNGGVFRTDLLAETHYFYCTFNTGPTPKDKVSKESMQTSGLAAGRVSYHGGPYGVNEPAIDENGLFGCGVIENLVPDPDDTSQWSGTGPWTNTVTVGTGTHALSTDLNGATVSISAGTATIDGTASATYENSDNFEVTGAGTVTIQTDTADPKAQITATEYKLPYVDGLSPENYSDADQGDKFAIQDQLLDALDGACTGTEVVSNTSTGIVVSAWGYVVNVTNVVFVANATYDIVIDAKVTTGSVYPKLPNDLYAALISESGQYRIRITTSATPGTVFRLLAAASGFTGDISCTVTKVSSAQGKLTCTWRPMYSSGDLTGTINILTANDEAGTFLFFDADNDWLKLTDGTNTSQVACSPVVDTAYEITLQYDATNGMLISLDGTAGTTAAFAGMFPTADDLSYFWNAEVPQYVKITSIEKESGL